MQTTSDATTRDVGPADVADLDLEPFRKELTGYCYRMLGSGFEAEDAVQETMVRAWKAYDRFEGRSSLRSWVYRIATNVCLDMGQRPQRRARPMDLGPASPASATLAPPSPENTWVSPIQDGKVLPTDGDPAELAAARDSIRLAFVAALQHLPSRQRAVLILREVLRWQATEVAELLDTTVASVNSALQRARATLDSLDLSEGPSGELDEAHEALLTKYLEAFESYDVEHLVTLLADDVKFDMPPFALWLNSPEDVGQWMVGQGAACRGSKLVPVQVNGGPGYAQYKPAEDGTYRPWSITALGLADGKVTEVHNFLTLDGPELFLSFGLPDHLPADA